MVKCPLCQFDNEDGSLFCEQCKADLGSGAYRVAEEAPFAASAAASEAAPEVALAEPVAVATAVPVETAVPMDVGVPLETPPSPEAVPAATPVLAPAAPLPSGTQPRLVVIRGLKINTEYPIYEGQNFIGRTDDKPVDIDVEDQEAPDRLLSSRQHACITFENGTLELEDLNSSNGTFVNRTRVYPGQKRSLNINDVVQIGTVQMRVKG